MLQREIEPLLTRPVGRPSNAPVVRYAGFLYRANSWGRARCVVAKVEWHKGELFPRVGFIATNLSRADYRGSKSREWVCDEGWILSMLGQ